MSNTIGDVKGITGYSTALNGQPGNGGMKPSAKGKESPGGTKQPRPATSRVELNK